MATFPRTWKIAATLATCVVVALTAPMSAQAAQVGAVTDLSWGISQADATRTIGLLRDNGVGTVRVNMSWIMAEPNAKGSMDAGALATMDRLIDDLRLAGIEVLMPISDGVPYWASADPNKRIVDGERLYNAYYRPSNMQDYAEFVAFVVRRYAPKGVHLYEIWNEPNHSFFWPSGPSPAQYVEMLRAAYPAVKAADPQARVILGGLAGNDATYLSGIYAAGGRAFFDVAAVHPYTGAVDPEWCWNLPGTPTRAPDAFCGLEEVRRVMERNDDSDKQLWLTEFGWSTASAEYGVSESQQADYLTKAVIKLATYPWAERAYWYAFRNVSWSADNSSDLGANYGVLRTDFSAKPSLAALRDAAALTPTAPPPAPTPTPAPRDVAPSAYTLAAGSVYAGRGAVSRLAADDGQRVEITTAAEGASQVAEIQPTARITDAERQALRSLTIDFDGSVTKSSAALTLRVFNVTASAWETVKGPLTGSTAERTTSWSPPGSPGDYVSASGDIRFSVRATGSSSFRLRADLVRFRLGF